MKGENISGQSEYVSNCLSMQLFETTLFSTLAWRWRRTGAFQEQILIIKEGELYIRMAASLADGKALAGLPGDDGTAQPQSHQAQHGPHRTHPST
jgi:hypothetical protein